MPARFTVSLSWWSLPGSDLILSAPFSANWPHWHKKHWGWWGRTARVFSEVPHVDRQWWHMMFLYVQVKWMLSALPAASFYEPVKFIAQYPKALGLRDEARCDRGIAECTDRCKPLCRSAAPRHSSWLRSSLQSCIYFQCATNHLILQLLALTIFQHEYKTRQGQLIFVHFSVVSVRRGIRPLNFLLQICFCKETICVRPESG